MGVEPFLVASTVLLSLAQRLVRRVCGECKEAYRPTEEGLRELGLTLQDLERFEGVVYRPRDGGCEECRNLGYRGRTGIYELMPMRDDIGQMIINRADAGTIKKAAIQHGMRTLRDDGALKVLHGVTSVEEVLRVTAEDAILEL
jgi:general secretion pathway protein E